MTKIANALSVLGCVARAQELAVRHLSIVGNGAVCARPYKIPGGRYEGYPEDVDAIFLHYLQALKPGGGAEALKVLIGIADSINTPIVLSPSGYSTPLRPVPFTKDELILYYHRFGFHPLTCLKPGKWTNTLLIRPS